jgi:SagB-type dehydrogenase family enzyme
MTGDVKDGAWEYHQATKHSPARNRSERFRPDWSDQPRPFKLYRTLPAFPLPPAVPSGVPALSAIGGSLSGHASSIPSLPAIAAILRYSAGVIKRLRYAGGVMEFRAASSTGGLYHLELYLVCGDLPGLDAGVYHFGAPDLTLTRLRAGDWRGTLVDACAMEPHAKAAAALLVCTSTIWRNAWRYRERAFRHAFWDSGTLLANALAMAAAHEVPAWLLTGFADSSVSRLLGLDSPGEFATSLVALGDDPARPPRRSLPVPPLQAETVPVSRRERWYPIVERAYAATSLGTEAEVRSWRMRMAGRPAERLPETGTPAGPSTRFDPLPEHAVPQTPIEAVIQARRSVRRFAEAAIDGGVLAAILDAAMGSVPADYAEPHSPLHAPFPIVNAVRGLEPGAYVYHPAMREFELIKAGAFREHAHVLALDQVRAGFAAVNVYFVADLQGLLQAGERGYRIAQLDAALRGGRLYLGATAFGVGATALTFYDDAVIRFFSPYAAGREASFLVALGQPR